MKHHLNYKVYGTGHPVVILHGMFGTLDNWHNMARRLEEAGYMAILIDQRDHGRSEHTNAFNYPILAEDLQLFLEENWIYEGTIIGHSMGGKTCLQYMSDNNPDNFKFVIIDIGIKKYEDGHTDIFDALMSVQLDKMDSRNQVESILMNRLNDKGVVQFLMKNLTRTKDGHFEWKVNLHLLYKNYDRILEAIPFRHTSDAKTLFIRGSKSNYILDDDWPSIHETIPNSELITINGAGHWVHADKPVELFNHIIDFIK
ncbi:MAG TPA: alpha/beta fold hydrolase [Saprospiraceae bacterium]|nr:alpha/beta fold hydrolase [Saprospiraceae bacterium]HRO07603.1 alpha/beta fold hydrolase [Saprospiraceae bacterium]HRO72039.1 alpha/beta fold hydrolase [Saprospiraceae bacterium]HRP40886.1 alpha/beta fold hydrolase [Saprospiraceae bacterium]